MAADKGPLHQFEISNLYEIKLEGIDISLTNSALSMILSKPGMGVGHLFIGQLGLDLRGGQGIYV